MVVVKGSTRMRVAHEADHHGDAENEKEDLQRVDALVAEPEQVGERPAAREGGAEHLGADQHRGAEHRDDASPHDPAGGAEEADCDMF